MDMKSHSQKDHIMMSHLVLQWGGFDSCCPWIVNAIDRHDIDTPMDRVRVLLQLKIYV